VSGDLLRTNGFSLNFHKNPFVLSSEACFSDGPE
jgi:hypothetical protein